MWDGNAMKITTRRSFVAALLRMTAFIKRFASMERLVISCLGEEWLTIHPRSRRNTIRTLNPG